MSRFGSFEIFLTWHGHTCTKGTYAAVRVPSTTLAPSYPHTLHTRALSEPPASTRTTIDQSDTMVR
jgi:hypothetical protein